MKNSSRFLILSFAVFSLVGCRSIMDPTFVPTGYAHSGKEYKAAPGPKADDIGYEYAHEKNSAVMARWQVIAGEMVDELQTKAGITPDSIYIAKNASNAFNASFDYGLRQALIERGFYVSNNPDATYELSFDGRPENSNPKVFRERRYNGDLGHEAPHQQPGNSIDKHVLTLNIAKDGQPLGAGIGVYDVPPYGYKTQAFN